jgi:DNA-binding transcriptional regulator YhcF (GntR family)
VTSQPKYAQAAALIRAQIEQGALRPGQPVPSGAALARATGYSVLTCRKALRELVADGILVPGHSVNARPHVAVAPSTVEERNRSSASRVLSSSLAALRRSAGLGQRELATRVGVSITTVGHAETGRLWQGRGFWERTDKVLDANGELLRLHDAYRAASAPTQPGDAMEPSLDTPAMKLSALVSVTITWADGCSTTVYPPRS